MITFLAQPNTIEPAYSNLVFQFISTGATDPTKYKYRYSVNVYTNDGQVASLAITPSSEGWGQIDLSPILMNYTNSHLANKGCSGDTSIHLAAWGYLENNMLAYSIMVGEEYATTPTGVVIGYDGDGSVGVPAVRSNVCYTYNGTKQWFQGKQYDFVPFYLTGQTGQFPQYTSRFLTNSPRTRWIRTTDYSTLAALNYYDVAVDLPARQVYSALFTFYDEDNNIISTGRTYNVEANCGTRPFCNYYDHFWTNPTNFQEQQIVYLGVGVPNITEHGIVYPNGVKYYKVELEATLDTPTPPDPEIDEFNGCSCWEYQIYNPSLEAQLVFDYLNCSGDTETIFLNPEATASFCACQNTIEFQTPGSHSYTAITECDACVCLTYRVANSDPDLPAIFTYRDCNFNEQTGSVPADDFVDICACEDSIEAPGLFITELGTCPLPFSADCRQYGVAPNVSYVISITYTGCCGNEITANFPPDVASLVCANYPFPSSILWNETLLGTCSTTPCPTPTPTPTPLPLSTGNPIIAQNLCDGELMYFSYTGDTILPTQYFNYQYDPYKIISYGGGGLVPLESPFIFDTEAEVLSAFPCPTFTGNTCLTTTKISEPFYFYVDGECSPGGGDRVVYFMNSYGAWDSYNFRAKEDVGYGIEKQEYQSAPELYTTGWDSQSFYGWNSRRNVWAQNISQSGVIYTSYMPQSEMLWLSEELFQSPSVYLIGDDGVPMPIIITQTEVVVPNYQINSNKYQINIEYKSSYDTIRQNHE